MRFQLALCSTYVKLFHLPQSNQCSNLRAPVVLIGQWKNTGEEDVSLAHDVRS